VLGSQGPPLKLPAVELPEPPAGRGDANLWITPDAIWAAVSEGEPRRVVELESMSSETPELIETLAETLHRLADERGRYQELMVFTDPSFELVLYVDEGTKLEVLRRVLTTARATGHRRIRYASAEASVELSAEVPVRERRQFDEVMLVSGNASATAEAGLSLNRSPLARDALLAELQRRGRGWAQRCVVLDLDPNTTYANWLGFVAELWAIDVDCVTVPSPAKSLNVTLASSACERGSIADCPPAPSTDGEFTADLDALGEAP